MAKCLVVYLSLFNREFDVACLTETWVSEPGLFDDILDNYIRIHSPRLSRKGGGTAIYSLYIYKIYKWHCCLLVCSATSSSYSCQVCHQRALVHRPMSPSDIEHQTRD